MPAKRHEHAEAAGPGRRPDRGFADLHVHTAASDGSASVRETLRTAEHIGWLDLIAITDHDTVRGAVEARRIAAGEGLRIDVAIGEEITTRGGHVLGLFLEDRVEPGRSVADTIRAVHDQGGLAIPAHPVFPYRACVSAREIRAAAKTFDRGPTDSRRTIRRRSAGSSGGESFDWQPR